MRIAKIDTSVHHEQPLPNFITETVGAIGNSPARMIALLALTTFPEEEYVSTRNLNRRIQDRATGDFSESTGDPRETVDKHYYKRYLNPVKLAELRIVSQVSGAGRPPLGARLNEVGRTLGMAICGTLLPLELEDSRNTFLKAVLGPYPYFKRPNPRMPIYRQLLQGPASPVELKTATIHKLLTELSAQNVLDRTPGYQFFITEAIRPRLSKLITGLDLLSGIDDEAHDFRYNAQQNAAAIIKSPHSVAQLIGMGHNDKNEDHITWQAAARDVISRHGEIFLADLYQQAITISGEYVNYDTFTKSIARLDFNDRIIAIRRKASPQGRSAKVIISEPPRPLTPTEKPSEVFVHTKQRAEQETTVSGLVQVVRASKPAQPPLGRTTTHKLIGQKARLRSFPRLNPQRRDVPSPGLRFPAEWADYGHCFDEDDLFFPVGTGQVAVEQANEAKKICQQCPVWPACLKANIDNGSTHGISGGVWLEAGELTPQLRALAAKVKIE